MWVTAAVVLLDSIGGTVASCLATHQRNRKNPVTAFVWPKFPAVDHVAQGDRP
jgi:hypothetical protein